MVMALLFIGKQAITLAQLKATYFMPLIAIVFPFLIIYLINRSRFDLKVDENGISYRYWPFSRMRIISWTQINHAYMRKYDALGEYGGWGVKRRLWFKYKDKAYIFNDKNIGLQSELANEKRILFSSSKSEELHLFLINLKNAYPIRAIETDVRER
ncbi:hypothetical protein D9M68_700800 [compost metagenome]